MQGTIETVSLDEYEPMFEKDHVAMEWANARAKFEKERLRLLGVSPLIMLPKNYGYMRQETLIINRCEMATNFDFETRIQRILVGEPQVYPHKTNFSYVHVCLTY